MQRFVMQRFVMQRFVVAIALTVATLPTAYERAHAHHPEGVTYSIFQFPEGKTPKIDGDFSDWEIIPSDYTIDGSHLKDTVRGQGTNIDSKDLGIEVAVGWNPESNRLYFLYKMQDDVHNFDFSPDVIGGDMFEIVIDSDHSGGRYHTFEDVDKETESQPKSTTTQNDHIFTPPSKDKKNKKNQEK